MKILFVGSTAATSTSLHYYTNLVRQGHATFPWNPEFFSARRAGDRWLQKLYGGPTPQRRKQANQRLIEICRRNHFDLIFVMGENYVSAEAIEAIRRMSTQAPRFLFHSHDNLFANGIRKPGDFAKALAAYDIAFTTKSQNVDRYRALGQSNAHFIPSAFEPSVHRPIAAAESRLDETFAVSFIGTYDDSRLAWLQSAGWERMHVWGDGWRRFPNYESLKGRIHPQAIYFHEFADVCSRSLCSLGLLREEAEDRHTQRTFEIPACGTLQLAPRNDEIRTFFDENREIVLFDTPEELRDKIDFYLRNDSERERIARAGYERCLRDGHSYASRVTTMLDKLAAL